MTQSPSSSLIGTLWTSYILYPTLIILPLKNHIFPFWNCTCSDKTSLKQSWICTCSDKARQANNLTLNLFSVHLRLLVLKQLHCFNIDIFLVDNSSQQISVGKSFACILLWIWPWSRSRWKSATACLLPGQNTKYRITNVLLPGQNTKYRNIKYQIFYFLVKIQNIGISNIKYSTSWSKYKINNIKYFTSWSKYKI